jgi:glycosyltransferase involved in cell wall biosynthesis
MNDPRTASIVIVNYNYGRFVGAAIDSALAQTWPRVEVIVVDDGSTDDSRQIINGYGDRVRPIFKSNGGQASAANAGFAAATGDVIILLDADDVLLPDALSQIVPQFAADERVGHVHWPMWVIDADGNRSGKQFPTQSLPHGELRDAVIAGGPDVFFSPPCSGNAWRGALVRRVMPIPPDGMFRRHAEMYLVTLSPLFGVVRRLPTPQSCYRIHGGNDWASKSQAERDRRARTLYSERCQVLQRFLAGRGIDVDPQRWMHGSWWGRVDRLRADLARVVPRGERLTLIDQDELRNDLQDDWRVRPFPEHDGQYWGPPADDGQALAELDRHRRDGARYLAVAWPAFWWLQHYGGLRECLSVQCQRVKDNDVLIVFDLGERQVAPHASQPVSAAAS